MSVIERWKVRHSPFHQAFPAPNSEMTREIDRRIAVDRNYNFIYFRIPKAANSTVIRNLIRLEGTDDFDSLKAKRSFARASSLSKAEVNAMTTQFFVFTVVRNPFSRLASAYLDKIVRGKRADKVLKRLGKPAGTEVSFLEFTRYLAAGGVHDDPHWYRQVDLIPCGVERLHFVGRVETLDIALKTIRARALGTEHTATQEWTPHRTGADSRLGELYCNESIAVVQLVYAADFEAFDYSLSPA